MHGHFLSLNPVTWQDCVHVNAVAIHNLSSWTDGHARLVSLCNLSLGCWDAFYRHAFHHL